MAITTGYYDFTDGVTYGVPADGLNKTFLLKNKIDCTATADLVDISEQTDVKFFNIHEGWYVHHVWWTLQTASTLASVLDSIGDSAGAAYWVTTDSAALTSALGICAGDVHATDTNAVLNGKMYTADDYIYGIFKTYDFDGVLWVAALVTDVWGGMTIS